MQAMKDWYQEHPHLFHKRPYDRPVRQLGTPSLIRHRSRRFSRHPALRR